MDSKDVTSVMQPLLDEQAETAQRIQQRQARLAKLMLVLTTAVFSAFAAYTVQGYLASGEVAPLSLFVLVLLAAGVRNRWRAA